MCGFGPFYVKNEAKVNSVKNIVKSLELNTS